MAKMGGTGFRETVEITLKDPQMRQLKKVTYSLTYNRNKAETYLRFPANKKKQAKRGILEPRTLIEYFHMTFSQMY